MSATTGRWQTAEALDAMRQLGRNPRRFRRLFVHCGAGHEVCSLYQTIAGHVIVGRATALPTSSPAEPGRVGTVTTPLALTLADYASLMYKTRLGAPDVDLEDLNHWIGTIGTYSNPEDYKEVLFSVESFDDHAANESYRSSVRLTEFRDDQDDDWLVYFRCRCSRHHVSPDWLRNKVPESGLRRIAAPEPME